uniref:Uncharacterized protein n=1 Tax=Romanomermis culicivorax TaxID=13658 RepID=A0A915IUU6_ROMCU
MQFSSTGNVNGSLRWCIAASVNPRCASIFWPPFQILSGCSEEVDIAP